MTEQEIMMFMQQFGNYFPKGTQFQLQKMLSQKENLSQNDLWSLPLKDPQKATYFAYLVGVFGVDRFWLQQPVSATIKLMITICWCFSFLLGYVIDWLGGLVLLCTMLAMFIWYIIDIATASRRAKALNYTTLMTYLTH